MQVPAKVLRWLADNGQGKVLDINSVSGGCINHGSRIEVETGNSFFLKRNLAAPASMFAREAEGLALLAVPAGPRVPRAFIWGSDFILLEDLKPAARARDYWEVFGRKLAGLHLNASDSFGFDNDNFIGSTPQKNNRTKDGFEFFGRYRLGYQAMLAKSRGLLSSTDIDRIEQLAGRLKEWLPVQAPAIVHGDLWAGNMVADQQGQPAIIDPAAHYGWPETDLAMTALFGRPPDSFYRAYEEIRPLPAGFWKRADLYNLYHLLNHLNLFGSSYYPQVTAVLGRFV